MADVYLCFRIADGAPIGLLSEAPEEERTGGNAMQYLTEVYSVDALGPRARAYGDALKQFAQKLTLSERDAEANFIRTDEGLRLYEAFRRERLSEGGNANIF
jgi:hypothetical protein